MKRQELVYRKLKEMCEKSLNESIDIFGFTTSEIAQETILDRSNVSRELNELVKKGLVMKLKGRPVRYYDVETFVYISNHQLSTEEMINNEISTFDDMIGGGDGSLKIQIQQAKAAILYPTRGLHILLTGPTGTGKSTFAKKIYEYAVSMAAIKKNSKFVVFNCAEYADNPQLLLSILCGYKKGAFTGADTDKKGLIEEADGGILFLDEIHRLPPEGQEMLFTLIDYGKYRRLGDVSNEYNADVIIIGATTENKDAVLLKTFLRRIQVVIQLPALKDRPTIELLQFIELFFSNEQSAVSIPISVHKDVIIALMSYNCSGNVGQLKSDIQLLCARAFWEYKVSNNHVMVINKHHLPVNIEESLFQKRVKSNDIVEYISNAEEHYVFISKDEDDLYDYEDEYLKGKYYKIISSRYLKYKKYFANKGSGLDTLYQNLEEYINALDFDKGNLDEALLKIVSPKVHKVVQTAIHFAEIRLEKTFSEKVKAAFILHIDALVNNANREMKVDETLADDIIKKHQNEYKTAQFIIRILEEDLDINIDDSEMGFIVMFLCADDEIAQNNNIGVIIVAHGVGTASGIAETVNRLLQTSHCRSINMSLDESVESAYKKTLNLVREVDEGKGVLLLVDMGSLNMFANRINNETGINVESVEMVSSLMAIEAVRKSMSNGYELNEIVDYLKNMVSTHFNKKNNQGHFNNNDFSVRKKIIVTCMSGAGAALKISDMIKKILRITEHDNIDIINKGFFDKNEIDSKDVVAIVGTVDLKLKDIPFISLDELVLGNGVERIEKLIRNSHKSSNINQSVKEYKYDNGIINSVVNDMLNFLDFNKVSSYINDSFNKCCLAFNISHTKGIYTRYVVHSACMLERLYVGEIFPHKHLELMKEKYNDMFEIVKKSFYVLEKTLSINIPDSEIAYLVDIMLEYVDTVENNN